jgi:DNA recombination protein RmuC
MTLFMLFVGLAVGAGAVYLGLRGRLAAAVAAGAELGRTHEQLAAAQTRVAQLDAELVEAGHELARACENAEHERAAAAERLQTAREQGASECARLDEHCAGLRAELSEAREQLACARGEFAEQSAKLGRDLVKLQGELEREQSLAEEKLSAVERLNERYAEAFKAMSADALKANNENFLTLARQSFEALQTEARTDISAREKKVAELVAPVTETLKRVDGQLKALDAERRETRGALTSQLRAIADGQDKLRGETSNLVAALRQPQTRGRWGEMQLRRVVEVAGMLAHCDFVEQSSVHVDGRTLRPDLVVNLPGGKQVVVDAKAPLQAYLDAAEADTDDERERLLRAHARQLREHMRKLGAKSYWSQFQSTPDFVVMFLPGEQFSAAALQADPSLIEEGVDQSVFLATPVTLITLLRAVSYGWQQEKVADGARAISELGRELHTRLAVLADHVQTLGRRLNSTVSSYNEVVGSLERRVLPAARKFSEHGAVGAATQLPELTAVSSTARAVAVPELTAGDDRLGDEPDPKPNGTLAALDAADIVVRRASPGESSP